MVAGLTDVHVDFRITSGLRHRGMDVVTAQELSANQFDDESLLVMALGQQRVMLTNDNDFQEIAARLQAAGHRFAPIVLWPQNKRGIGQLIDSVIRLATQRQYDDICSQIFYL